MTTFRVGWWATAGAVLGLVATFVMTSLVRYAWYHSGMARDLIDTWFSFVSQMAFLIAGIVGGLIGALIACRITAPSTIRVFGWCTLAGLMAMGLAIVSLFFETAYPTPMIPFAVGGLGCCLLAGIPWAFMPGKRKRKAAFLGCLGFVVGGASGALLGSVLMPGEPDNIGEIVYVFEGFVVGGLLLASLGVLWTIRFHRRYAAEPDRCT